MNSRLARLRTGSNGVSNRLPGRLRRVPGYPRSVSSTGCGLPHEDFDKESRAQERTESEVNFPSSQGHTDAFSGQGECAQPAGRHRLCGSTSTAAECWSFRNGIFRATPGDRRETCGFPTPGREGVSLGSERIQLSGKTSPTKPGALRRSSSSSVCGERIQTRMTYSRSPASSL